MGYRAERNAGSGESLVGTRAHGADRVEVDHDLNLQSDVVTETASQVSGIRCWQGSEVHAERDANGIRLFT
jgi:hypothetical protein